MYHRLHDASMYPDDPDRSELAPPSRKPAPIVTSFRWAGTLLLSLSCWLFGSRAWFLSHSQATLATVTAIEQVPAMSGTHPTFKTVFSYTTTGGQIYQAKSSVGVDGGVLPGQVGARIPIRYDPRHPEHAMPLTRMELWFGGIITGASALFFLVFAAILHYALNATPRRTRTDA